MRMVLVVTGILGLVLGNSGSLEAGNRAIHPYIRRPHQNNSGRSTVAGTEAPWTVANLCKAYNFPAKTLAGGGVIGILEFGGGWNQTDLNNFSKANGLPTINVTSVSVDGTTNRPGRNLDDDIEVALDIQMAAASYYYATGKMPTIYVFFSNGDYINTIKQAVSHNCSVLSISWGSDEKSWQSEAPGYAQQVESAAATAAASGLTIFAAAGDNSSSDGDRGNNVDLPAACPHVVACGGTTKTTVSEVVWGDGNARDEGTGGGYSAIFSTQSFQIGAPAAPKGLGRMVPDVTADADPNTGVIVYVDGKQYQIGGTSMVAPFYAGFFASLGPKLGFVTPTLWKNQAAFTDITIGSNGTYSAAKGPDPCSGVGAPNGASIAALFKTVSTTTGTKPANVVAVNYNTATHTLTLTGDTSSNTLSISKSGSSLVLQAGGATLIASSIDSAPPSTATSTATIAGVSGSLTVTGQLSDGNDQISLINLPINTITLGLGNGNDTIAVSLCTVGTSAIDGGAGVDVITTAGSRVTTNENINFP
jgi:kumamolisin